MYRPGGMLPVTGFDHCASVESYEIVTSRWAPSIIIESLMEGYVTWIGLFRNMLVAQHS